MNRYTGNILEDMKWYEYEHNKQPTKLYLNTDDYYDVLTNINLVHSLMGTSRFKLYGMNVILTLDAESRYAH